MCRTARRPSPDRRASSKKAHGTQDADYSQETRASKWQIEREGDEDIKEAVADGDKAGEEVQAAVDKEDADFDPENPAEDEVEAVPADEADDAGKRPP